MFDKRHGATVLKRCGYMILKTHTNHSLFNLRFRLGRFGSAVVLWCVAGRVFHCVVGVQQVDTEFDGCEQHGAHRNESFVR